MTGLGMSGNSRDLPDDSIVMPNSATVPNS